MAAANRINHAAVAFWCFAMSVAWLPIGLGGDRPVPLGLAQAGLALSCLFLFLEPKNLSRTPFFPRLRWALGLLAAVAVWAWLQTQSFMPAAWVHPVWQEASEVLKTPLAGTIAVSPEDALYGLSRFITCIAAGLLAYTLGQDTHRARQFVQALWLTGVVICAYGLLVQITGSHKILWLDKWIFSNDLTATFINRDDFALYAGIVLVCGVALLAQSWQEDVLAKRIHRRPVAIKEWLMRHGITEVFMLALVVTSIVLSHSRAGFVLGLAGIGGYAFFYQIYCKAWRRAILVALLALLGAAFALVLIVHAPGSRFADLLTDNSSRDRFKVYGWALDAIRANPWLGYGLNGFPAVYRLYQQDMNVLFMRAHSDWLESLLDLGLPAGLVLWAAIALLLSGLLRGVMRRRRYGMFPVLGLTASLMVLAHAAIDFSLQIPGIALSWSALLGLGLAQSWGQADKQALARRKD